MVIATSDGTNLDVSPKGDPAGFVQVESEKTLLIPDRPGNNRIDGMMNILDHPNGSLIFLVPTIRETLRVNGQAEILDDQKICDQFQINGRSPKTVLIPMSINLDFLKGIPRSVQIWRPPESLISAF